MEIYSTPCLVDAKSDYTQKLVRLLKKAFMQRVVKMLQETKDDCMNYCEDEEVLLAFQEKLANIVDWSTEAKKSFTDEIVASTHCEWLDDLIKAVFILHTKILATVRSKNPPNKVNISVPEIHIFLHQCFVDVARELWKHIYLFRKTAQTCEYQQNYNKCEELIAVSISDTIRDLLPIKEMLREHLSRNHKDDEIDYFLEKRSKKKHKRKMDKMDDETSSTSSSSSETSSDTENDAESDSDTSIHSSDFHIRKHDKKHQKSRTAHNHRDLAEDKKDMEQTSEMRTDMEAANNLQELDLNNVCENEKSRSHPSDTLSEYLGGHMDEKMDTEEHFDQQKRADSFASGEPLDDFSHTKSPVNFSLASHRNSVAPAPAPQFLKDIDLTPHTTQSYGGVPESIPTVVPMYSSPPVEKRSGFVNFEQC